MSLSPSLFRFGAFAVAYFLSFFFRSANAVIAADLRQEVGLGPAELGFMTGLFFAAYAGVQLPVGVALDRYGPQRVTPALMMLAALGSLIFSTGDSFATLALGRALIGVGMAGVLTGALKAFGQWYTAREYTAASGSLVGIGAAGGLMSATPLVWLNHAIGWRAVFAWAGLVVAASAGSIFILIPRLRKWEARVDAIKSPGGMRGLFSSLEFWRIALLAAVMTGTVFAFQGLWAGPYLADVAGFSNIQVGNIVFLLSSGIVVGYSLSGFLSARLGLGRVVVVATSLFALVQMALALTPPRDAIPVLFALFGITGAFNIMLLAQARLAFPVEMTGRAVTAVNLFAIGGTFFLQWGIGLVVGRFAHAGHLPPQAYMAVLLATTVLTVAALLWYLPLSRRAVFERG